MPKRAHGATAAVLSRSRIPGSLPYRPVVGGLGRAHVPSSTPPCCSECCACAARFHLLALLRSSSSSSLPFGVPLYFPLCLSYPSPALLHDRGGEGARERRVVYREWTCAMLVPVFGPTAADAGRRKTADGGLPAQAAAAAPPTAAAAAEGSLAQPPPPPPAPSPMKPCREFCHRVEEQCPYFHPTAREQYAGEPVFICIVRTVTAIISPWTLLPVATTTVAIGPTGSVTAADGGVGGASGGGADAATVLCALGDRGGDGGDSVVGGGPDPRPAQNPLLIAPAARLPPPPPPCQQTTTARAAMPPPSDRRSSRWASSRRTPAAVPVKRAPPPTTRRDGCHCCREGPLRNKVPSRLPSLAAKPGSFPSDPHLGVSPSSRELKREFLFWTL
ncbi:hypothetical protein MRX96_017114 [Rhipicephalus microplus]